MLRSASADLALARSMASRLGHRGPDDEGEYLSSDGRCAIAFHRLAVMDPQSSHQPMSLADGSAVIAFNGEIYNFRQLRKQLAADGTRFATDGDTEVLLHLYRNHGLAMVEHLRGMFAFVIHDIKAGTIFIARDRLGQKPLWYAALEDRIVFASEAKALLIHPGISRKINHTAITYYLSIGYIPAPLSPWVDIRKLPPASTLHVGTSIDRPERYWKPGLIEIPQSESSRVELVRSSLSSAVMSRANADVPLGALLSGGVDSSIVTALLCKAAGATGGVKTFCARFSMSAYDEGPKARIVADHCGTDHTEFVIQPQPEAALNGIIDHYDEPFGDSSAIPTFLICQAARQHVTAALCGDGGDEVFGGYDRYRAMYISSKISPPKFLALKIAAALARIVASTHQRSKLRRLIRLSDGINKPPAMQYLFYRQLFSPNEISRLFTDEWADKADISSFSDWFCDLYEKADFDDILRMVQHHDLETYLPDDLLVKTDIASMATSLELRAPFLDHEVVNLGLSIPADEKISNRSGKLILRRAFADLLPPEVFESPKQGFGVPLAQWLRGPLASILQETLLDDSLLEMGIFNPVSLAGLVAEHLGGKHDHSHRLWALLVLAKWLAR